MKKAIMVIDMLNDFIEDSGTLYIRGGQYLVAGIQYIIRTARSNNIPIIYINDAHDKDDIELCHWAKHCIKGTWGAEVISMLAPKENDIIIEKKELSAFSNPLTQLTLQKLGVYELYVVGVATDYCVKETVIDARNNGYKVNIIVDAIKGLTLRQEYKALIEMGNVKAKGIYIEDVENYLSE
jgi:nicotinamidase-related amidase